MFFRILKKDLKRKKTMNIILLLFVILCSMFAAAGVNNIAAVTDGIEHYFKTAGVPDITILGAYDGDGNDEKLRALPDVTDIKRVNEVCVANSKCFTYNGKKMENFINSAYLVSDSEMYIHCYDTANELIERVEQGSFYCTAPFLQNMDIKPGETVTLEIGGITMPLTFSGRFKNPIYQYQDGAIPHVLLNHADFERVAALRKGADDFNALFSSGTYLINTSNLGAVQDFIDSDDALNYYTYAEWKGIYTFDMLAAYVMMAVCAVLMMTAFFVLRFTIGFSISEEFREIGVMKAVGIENRSIRGLYFAKYLAISVVGAVIGFFASIPLSGVLMKAVSENIVLTGESESLLGVFSAAGVVVLILLFCYFCTRKVNRLSPIDAVRSGQTGERFKKRSLMHLGKSKLGATGFLSVNDVLSAPKRFGLITAVFTLCMLLITMMSNFAMTLKSETILWLFNVPESEAHVLDMDTIKEVMMEPASYQQTLDEIRKKTEECGLDADLTVTLGVNSETFRGDQKAVITYIVSKGDISEDMRMDAGSAPQKNDEIAMTGRAMERLGASIGDRVTTTIDGKEYEFIITGRFSSFSENSARLHSDFETGSQTLTFFSGVQLHFRGNPDADTIEQNIAALKTAMDTDKIYNTSDMIDMQTQMSDTLNATHKLMLFLTVILVLMIVILMERSFISKEKSELALMKAVGISNASIITQHTLRFLIV